MLTYNLRVYAVIIRDNAVLVSDECRHGRCFTKFPGGGLQWGEGLKEALQRELQEEMALNAEVGDLFYVNDFFQISAFRDTEQLLSFYFSVDEIDLSQLSIEAEFNPVEGQEKFRWISLADLNDADMTFPIDKEVIQLILA